MINNELQVLQHIAGETPARQQALDLHFRLKADIEIAGNAIADFTEKLKEMRDNKFYLELGYEKFGDYTQQEHRINERQAYNYINAFETYGKEFLQSNAKSWGITKLQLLASASPLDREQIIKNTDVENTSVSELKAKIAEIESLKQQLSFLQDNPITVEKQSESIDVEKLTNEIRQEQQNIIDARYKRQIQELQDASMKAIADLQERTITDDELQEYKTNAAKEAKFAAAEDIKKIKAELKEQQKIADESHKLALEASTEKERLIAESKSQEAFREKYLQEQERAEKLEKQIKLAENPQLARFKFIFTSWDKATSELLEQLNRLDEQSKAKMTVALKTAIGGIEL